MKPSLFAIAGLIAGGAVACLAETAPSARIEPGLWEVSSAVTSGDMPGAQADVGAVTRQAPTVSRRCLTPADAARGPEALLLNARPDCTASRSTMADGKLDALLHCAPGTKDAMTVAIKASFTPKSYEAVSNIVMASDSMAMTVNVTGKWVRRLFELNAYLDRIGIAGPSLAPSRRRWQSCNAPIGSSFRSRISTSSSAVAST